MGEGRVAVSIIIPLDRNKPRNNSDIGTKNYRHKCRYIVYILYIIETLMSLIIYTMSLLLLYILICYE